MKRRLQFQLSFPGLAWPGETGLTGTFILCAGQKLQGDVQRGACWNHTFESKTAGIELPLKIERIIWEQISERVRRLHSGDSLSAVRIFKGGLRICKRQKSSALWPCSKNHPCPARQAFLAAVGRTCWAKLECFQVRGLLGRQGVCSSVKLNVTKRPFFPLSFWCVWDYVSPRQPALCNQTLGSYARLVHWDMADTQSAVKETVQ